ncbi:MULTISPECIES: FtsW/RodA/SpoVE family cell cycle protein [Leptotrichia]|uniref:Probable peptidoglycan glycosyltransferase FtsW n=1 Tax=Leptotrichia wadei TaxID=157687 RepID=A0A510L089_9FUSO|nr:MULTISPECIES: FtsW/RodA/SpoVE family cell cycle protein [Leptotrichia]MBS6019980.1 FtsW/RodA/SpoVE family cell cycle protein [Leptotrichia wadei]NWO28247.1 FtsW/RodA/SpoVE family cell cycle protein [Leptotrichia sp. oral taxon 417]BBM55883.1 cell cycle protein [Leptotrichia wadei]VTX52140.1 putative peptidoglycan glycosyltransferase FtsW [uncultured Leptotrichia sp.]
MNRKKILGTGFIIVILILSALSIITMASLSAPRAQNENKVSYYYLMRQMIWLIFGWLGFLVTANLNYKKYREITKYLYVIGAFSLVMVLVIGTTKNGAKRWIDLGMGMRIQPSEFVKLILIVVLSTLVYNLKIRNKISKHPWLSSIVIMGTTGVYMFLILFEKSFSNTVQIAIIGMTYLLVSELKFSIIALYTGLGGILGWFGVMKVGYRASRIAEHTSKEIGFQTTQSLIAISNGKIFGKFYGNGFQKYGFLPEIHTDYIFSGYAEENGFLGILFLLGLYAALLIIIGITLKKVKDLYAKYLLAGIFIIIATQVIGNVAVTSKIIPSTGIPLPMMSYGGSTMVAMMLMLGIVYNIIRTVYKQEMGNQLDELNEIDYMM